jgi:hypothetical protein
MRQLYEFSTAPTKIWKAFPGGDHNSSVIEEGYFEAIADFISQTTGQVVFRDNADTTAREAEARPRQRMQPRP